MMDNKPTYCGHHLAIYAYIESCCISETNNIMLIISQNNSNKDRNPLLVTKPYCRSSTGSLVSYMKAHDQLMSVNLV